MPFVSQHYPHGKVYKPNTELLRPHGTCRDLHPSPPTGSYPFPPRLPRSLGLKASRVLANLGNLKKILEPQSCPLPLHDLMELVWGAASTVGFFLSSPGDKSVQPS